MASQDDIPREVLPIPDRKPVSLTTYDAKDRDTKFPPIRIFQRQQDRKEGATPFNECPESGCDAGRSHDVRRERPGRWPWRSSSS
jgi:hypothetical protein